VHPIQIFAALAFFIIAGVVGALVSFLLVAAPAPPIMPVAVGLLFSAALFGFGLSFVVGILGRRTRVDVEVGPNALEVRRRWAGFLARGTLTLERDPHEHVELVAQRGGRGSLPSYGLKYGATLLYEFSGLAMPPELEVALGRLRAALAAVPRAPG